MHTRISVKGFFPSVGLSLCNAFADQKKNRKSLVSGGGSGGGGGRAGVLTAADSKLVSAKLVSFFTKIKEI